MKKTVYLLIILTILGTVAPIASADNGSEVITETPLEESLESVTSSSQTRVLYHVTREEVMGYKYTEEPVEVTVTSTEIVRGSTRDEVNGEVESKVEAFGTGVSATIGGVYETTNGFECSLEIRVTTNNLVSFRYPKIYLNKYAICETVSDLTPSSVGNPSLQEDSEENLHELSSAARRFEILVSSTFYKLGTAETY